MDEEGLFSMQIRKGRRNEGESLSEDPLKRAETHLEIEMTKRKIMTTI
jgi:hypothetical protein